MNFNALVLKIFTLVTTNIEHESYTPKAMLYAAHKIYNIMNEKDMEFNEFLDLMKE